VRVALLLLLLLSACPARYSRILDGHWPTKEWKVVEDQRCGHKAEMEAALAKVLPVVLEELEKALPGSRVQVEAWWMNVACLVEEPERCTMLKCDVPNPDKRCTRRRGCSWTSQELWVARWWPPICTVAWPAEPSCVKAGAPRSSKYLCDLAHEVEEVMLARLGKVDYAHSEAGLKLNTRVCARLP